MPDGASFRPCERGSWLRWHTGNALDDIVDAWVRAKFASAFGTRVSAAEPHRARKGSYPYRLYRVALQTRCCKQNT